MTDTARICDYCGLRFRGDGYSPDGEKHFCCMGCYLVRHIVRADGAEGVLGGITLRFGVGAFLAMNVMMLSLVLYMDSAADLGAGTVNTMRWALFLLSTPAVIILGFPFAISCIKNLLGRRLGSDALVIMGTVSAFAVSTRHVLSGEGQVYYDTATMLLAIMTLGRLLEASAKSRTAKAIRTTVELTPETAHVRRGGEEVEIPAGQVQLGDLVIVRPGGRIPVDGRIVEGHCMVDEAPFTGESWPRFCTKNVEVFGGSLNCDGAITVEATSDASNSLVDRMKEMVAAALEKQGSVERFADRVSAVFIPAVWAISIGAAAYWGVLRHNPERAGLSALAVLVIACPCALGIAVSMAVSIGMGKAARLGVLVRSGEAFERLASIERVFLDKTGTLTDGRLRVEQVHTSDAIDEDKLIGLAASLEYGSEHVIGRAIVSAAAERGIAITPVEDFLVIPGFGVEGRIRLNGDDRRIAVGSEELVGRDDVRGFTKSLRDDMGATTVYVGCDDSLVGAIVLRDSVRKDAYSSLRALRSLGITTSILSGDKSVATRRIADELGIAHSAGGSTPTGKVEIVRNERRVSHGLVAMVGDGINDALALAEADIGIAVGSGLDLARESSDVLLLGDDLSRIPWVIELSRMTLRIVRRNLWWAFGYNLVSIGLAFMGFVHPLIAAVSMFVSSLSVISNSLRLVKYQPSSGTNGANGFPASDIGPCDSLI